jgi:dienelactone hydrolase
VRRRDLFRAGLAGFGLAVAAACDRAKPAPPAAAGPSLATSPSGSPLDRYSPPPIQPAELKKLFEYDSTAALNATLTDRGDEAAIRVEELTFANGKGGNSVGYVLSPLPPSGSRLPGVVFAHGGGSGIGRTTWLAEAKVLVKRGMVAVLPEVPLTLSGKAAQDSALVVHAVVAQRRALDLLARRSDVDAGRLGFVGHSWGAMQGQILAGVEPRLAAIVVAAGADRFSRFLYNYLHPAEGLAYVEALSRFDGSRYVALGGKRTILLQYGRRDETFLPVDQNALAEQTAGNHERKDYDTGHDLVGFQPAVADRQAFLRSVLHVK